MGSESILTRREIVKWGLLSTGAPILSTTLGTAALAQDLGPGNRFVGDIGGRDAEKLYTGYPIVGGGQMEIRLNQSIYTDSEPIVQAFMG